MGTMLMHAAVTVMGIAVGVAVGRLSLALFFALAAPMVTRLRT